MNTQPDTTTLAGKLAVMQAAMEGKRIQYNFRKENPAMWICASSPAWNWPETDFRIHPDDLNPPKLRPWRPEEVPVGALFKFVHGHVRCLIVSHNRTGIVLPSNATAPDLYTLDFAEALNHLHSTDGGKTWQPCGVLE